MTTRPNTSTTLCPTKTVQLSGGSCAVAGSAGVSDSGRGGGEPENSQIAVAAGGSLLLAQRKRCQALANRLGHQPPAFLNLRAQFEFFRTIWPWQICLRQISHRRCVFLRKHRPHDLGTSDLPDQGFGSWRSQQSDRGEGRHVRNALRRAKSQRTSL